MSVYAISDLHGRFDLYQEIKKFLHPEDIVYCLGDCGDRGPDGWKLIKEVYRDQQFRYLMGNHEHMLIGAMQEYLEGSAENFYRQYPGCYNSMYMLLAYNGGENTIQGWIGEGANQDWFLGLMTLPYEEIYVNENGINILLSHAGYTPSKKQIGKSLLWDRDHIFDPWNEQDGEKVIVVHGHTPCSYLSENLNMVHGEDHRKEWAPFDGSIWYANGHKIDIDMGTYSTGHAIMLDLNTFDEHIFYMEET